MRYQLRGVDTLASTWATLIIRPTSTLHPRIPAESEWLIVISAPSPNMHLRKNLGSVLIHKKYLRGKYYSAFLWQEKFAALHLSVSQEGCRKLWNYWFNKS